MTVQRTPHRIYVGKDVHKFSSAHMSVFPDGTKERLHGHNFQVSVLFELHSTALSNFLDFGAVKRALTAQCEAWDQRLLLAERCPHLSIVRSDGEELEFRLCGQRYVVPAGEVLLLPLENIVVETLAEAFGYALVKQLGPILRTDVVAAVEVSVEESASQGGTYRFNLDA